MVSWISMLLSISRRKEWSILSIMNKVSEVPIAFSN